MQKSVCRTKYSCSSGYISQCTSYQHGSLCAICQSHPVISTAGLLGVEVASLPPSNYLSDTCCRS